MKFECKDCTNRNTTICDQCTFITNPSGNVQRPSNFTRLSKIKPEDVLAAQISMFLEHKLPIPVSVVIEYNELTQEE